MSETIANLGTLQSLSDSFIDVVVFYLASWSPYHAGLRAAAAGVVIPAGILWTSIQIFKWPVNKGATAVGGLILASFAVWLLSPASNTSKMFGAATPPAGVTISTGSYYSFVLPAEFYTLFKSALENSRQTGHEAARLLAYDMNTNNVAQKWDDTPLKEAYVDFVGKCTTATKADAKADDNIEALGHVGLHAGSGLGYTKEDHSEVLSFFNAYNNVGDNFYGEDTGWFGTLAGTTGVGWVVKKGVGLSEGVKAAWNADTMEDMKGKGIEILGAIPESANPYTGVASKLPSGYKIPTAAYWKRRFNVPNVTGPDYIDASEFDGGKFKNPDVIDSGTNEQAANIGFYPENCVEAYEMSDLGVAEYRKALAALPEFAGKPAAYTTSAILSDMVAVQTFNRMRANAAASGNSAAQMNSAALPQDQTVGNFANDTAVQLYALTQSTGAKIAEWMLQVKMPFFISTLAMMCAALIIAFPVFVILSIFLGPGILVSYIKLIIFCFLVMFLNELFLAMGADLIAMNKQMNLVYSIGNIAKNNAGLELSSATAEVVIFTSLTVIETVVAKMLIWDDVKGMTAFNPGAAGDAATSTGAAAIKMAASLATGAYGLSAKAASKTASQASTQLNKTLTTAVARNGGNIAAGVQGIAGGGGGQQGGGSGRRPNQSSPSSQAPGPAWQAKQPTQPSDDNGPKLTPKD